jgi:hypothetical protein
MCTGTLFKNEIYKIKIPELIIGLAVRYVGP